MRKIQLSLLMLAATVILAATAVLAGDLPELKFEKYRLSNGLDVILHEDHSIPIVSVNVWYHVGSKNEKAGRTGFAHLFEHMMFQGSEHFNTDYFNAIDKIGGDNNGSTSEDRTNYWENVPGNYLERALWLEADRMGNLLPAMTQERLDNQRDVVKNERRQGMDNQPYAKSYEIMLALLYPDDHPYHHSVIGSMDDLSAASLQDVEEFFKLYYTPNNASLCIAGDFDPALAKQWVEKYFGPIPPGMPIDRMKEWIPKLAETKREVAEDAVNLPRLYMSWNTPAFYKPGDAEFDLLGNILSSGMTSRLYKALVYEKQIAQDVAAYQSSNEISSTFNIEVTGKEGQKHDELEHEVNVILNDVLSKGITGEELAQAKTSWEAGFVRGIERVGGFGGRADRLNQYNVMLGDPSRLQWDMNRYSSATIQGVNGYAREYLDPNGCAILYIYPQGDLTVSKETTDMAVEPAAAPEPSFVPPEIQKAKLSNGMDLFLVENHDLPLVQVNILVKSGWASDPAGRPGAAALTSELLDEGTKTKSALQISEEAKKLGADLGTGSSFDNSMISLNVLKKNLGPALALMSDFILNPTFPQDELDRQKQIYLGRIQQESREPFTTAFKIFFKELYGENHPYGEPYTGSGTESSIKAIDRSDLESFYRNNYVANNASAIVVGDIKMEEAKSTLENAFKKWKSGTVSPVNIRVPRNVDKTMVYLIDKPGAPQSVIIAGNLAMQRNDPDYLAAQVMDNALGGQFTSRINMNLREDKGYTYGAHTFFTSRRGPGALVGYAQVQSQFTKESVEQFIKEYTDIQGARPLSNEELGDSKSNLTKGFPQDFQTYSGIAGRIADLITYGLPDDEWKTYMSRVNAIDENAASEAAKQFIHPDALLIVVVGDLKKIESGIKELGYTDTVHLNPN